MGVGESGQFADLSNLWCIRSGWPGFIDAHLAGDKGSFTRGTGGRSGPYMTMKKILVLTILTMTAACSSPDDETRSETTYSQEPEALIMGEVMAMSYSG